MTDQAVDKGIPTETCIHDLKKMLIYSIINSETQRLVQNVILKLEKINIADIVFR